MTAKKVITNFSNCIDCPHHSIISDSDPDDWFCDDDIAVVCTKTKKRKNNITRYAADKSPYRCVTISCRPYNARKESETPNWCPL